MIKYRNIIVSVLLAVLAFAACKESSRVDMIDYSIPAPGKVTLKEVIPTPGGAVVKYDLPDDVNLHCVKVVYNRNGEICESKSSRYVDSLVIEGFGDTEVKNAKIYSQAINGKTSDPVEISFTPLTPPVQAVKYEMEASFGGLKISLTGNDSNADLAMVVLVDSLLTQDGLAPSQMDWEDLYTYYISSKEASYMRTGLSTDTKLYGMYVRDRWGNHSDTLYWKLTPWEEYLLPVDSWKRMLLPGDNTATYSSGTVFSYLIDELNSTCFRSPGHDVKSYTGYWITIDMGYVASLSRYLMRGFNPTPYSGRDPWWWQIYGSLDPNPDGSLDDSWFLLDDRKCYKPSGYAEDGSVGIVTDEDKNFYENIFEYSLAEPTELVPDPQRPVRYLRLWCRCSFANMASDMTDMENLKADRFEIARFNLYGSVISK